MTGRDSRPIPDGKGGYFIEQIQTGAFKKALRRAEEIKIMLNHKPNRILGNTKENLTLSEDIVGLRAHTEITDPEVVQKAKEKRLRGWSFAFCNPKEISGGNSDGIPRRIITDMEIYEVSLIDENMRPWYPATTVEARAGEESEMTLEIRAEEFETEYVGFETEKEKVSNKRLKEIIEKYGGKV